MPRNVSGTYTLPLPPVVPNTTIESIWANTSLDDIAQALTDSLDREGRGGMNAPFRVPDGTEAQPSFSFTSSTGSGMWVDATHLGFSFQGDEKMQITAAGVVFTGGAASIQFQGGTAAAPGIAFAGDSDTGIYSDVANSVKFTTAGVEKGRFGAVPGFFVGNELLDSGSANVGLYLRPRLESAGLTQYGILESTMLSNSVADNGYGLYINTRMAGPTVGVQTITAFSGVRVVNPASTANQTIENVRAFSIDALTAGTVTNHGIYSQLAPGTGKRFIWSAGGAFSYHEGNVGIGTDALTNPKLLVRTSAPAASPTWQSVDVAVFQATSNAILQIHAGDDTGVSGIGFSHGTVRSPGGINYDNDVDIMRLFTNTVNRIELDAVSLRSTVKVIAPNVYTGAETGQGFVSVVDGLPSGQTALSTADAIVIDSNTNSGLSILTPSANVGQIVFGDPGASNVGAISYSHSTDAMSFRVNAATRLTITSNTQISAFLKTEIIEGTASGQTANTNADTLVLDSTGNTGISMLGSTTAIQQILFGDTAANARGVIAYGHTDDVLAFSAAGVALVSVGEPNLKVYTDGSTSGVTANTAVDTLVLDGSGNGGLSMLGGPTSIWQFRFGRTGNNAIGGFSYNHSTDALAFSAGGATKLTLTSTLVTVAGDIVAGNLLSGSYSPTFTVGSNVTSVAAATWYYTRVGDIVTVTGRVTPNFSSTDNVALFDATLPIASALSSTTQLSGLMGPISSSGHKNVGTVIAQVTNDRATFQVRTEATGAQGFTMTFSYVVV